MKKNEWAFMNQQAVEQRKEAIKNGATPVLRETSLSYQAKAVLNRMGFEANTSLLDLPIEPESYMEVKGCDKKTAKEIARLVTQFKVRRRAFHGFQQ